MDPFAELEQMALNATEQDLEQDKEPSDATISLWHQLFGFSFAEAANVIRNRREDYSRKRISDELWNIIRVEKEAQGYDREAYEYEFEVGSNTRSVASFKRIVPPTASQARAMCIVKLEGILDTPEKVQTAAKLLFPPEIAKGSSEDGDDSVFCTIDGQAKHNIMCWLPAQASNLTPTFARVLQKASKELSDYSLYPSLGIDSTLPQYRQSSATLSFVPGQDQYPVWYFFYGTLADPDILARQLLLRDGEVPTLKLASIKGGALKTWAGKYKALVDAEEDSEVKGAAYLVESKEHENALRTYETDNYEVVRCVISISIDDSTSCCDSAATDYQLGCTFRFVGNLSD